MNAMLGWIRILKTAGAQDTDLARRAVETIERNIGVQAQTVNDLLDMSRILSGKLQLDEGRVEFAAVVTGCIQSVKPSAEDKQIALRLNVKDEELEVLGDEARLQQVVANLLGNAIKFTDAGGFVTVTVEREDASASLVIEDTGQGIAPDFLPHLFERFTQADTGSTRTHGGLGLGLSIVKNIVSLHGGRIEANSAGLGRGARFSVVLPLANARQQAASRRAPSKPAVDDGTLGTLDVLLVEDDSDTREALQIVLQDHGSRVRSVASVRQALEAYDAQAPDLVMSDVGMPGENGYVLIRAIRDLEEGRSHRTLAIAITGFASREDHETALRAGFDEHVAKPVEADDLLDRVRVLAASRTEIGNRAT
jgi:CheY-like chemotaxis protein